MQNTSIFIRVFSKIQSYIHTKNILSKESLLFCVFIFAQIAVNTNKLYVPLAVVYSLGLYLISRNTLKAAWFTFISLLLFQQAKYFIETINIPTGQSYVNIPILYNISFADIALIFVVFLLKRNPEAMGY